MKKLAILILTVFTMATVVVCGCGDTKKAISFDDNAKTESVQIQEVEEDIQVKPECPDCEKRDGEHPAPRKPHKRHDRNLPQPKATQSR